MQEWWTDVAAWAWERHHNVLSWYVRPLFLLPFCWFAHRRNGWGIAATLLALVTSMAWFPAPARPDPAVVEMLRVERDHLLGAWTPGKIAVALLVPVVLGGIAVALWRRSVGWALVVINAGVLFKVAWTYAVDAGGRGADAHLPAAVLGLAAVDAAVVGAAWWMRRRRAAGAVR